MSPNILLLVTGGRNGSVLFHSLLDSHPEIVQFPGFFNVSRFSKEVENLKEPASIVENFINHHKHFFDLSLNGVLGLDRLGKDRVQSRRLSTCEFTSIAVKHITELGFNQSVENIIVSLHQSYYELCNGKVNLDKIKVILIHVHTLDNIGLWAGRKPDIMFMERDPLPALQSELETFMRYYHDELNMLIPWTLLHRKLLEAPRVVETGFPAYTIRLEDLHKDSDSVIQKFCKIYDLEYLGCLFESTFLGLKWWGDDLQLEPKNGLNPLFKNRLNEKCFFKWELACYEILFAGRLRLYDYPFRSSRVIKWPLLLLFILPSRFEYKYLYIVLKNCFSGDARIRWKGIKGLAVYVRSFRLKFEVWKSRKLLGHAPPLLR
jgi:hypothetical protein